MKERVDPTLANELTEGSPEKKIDVLFAYMEARGQSYYDEVVTQLEHALQCANLAQLANGDAIQITAALLHDIGHFLMVEHAENADFHTQDFLHEEVGAAYIAPFFIEAVTEPVKLHVPAKRYICTTDSTYYNTLSQASKHSFQLQGGLMSGRERTEFESNPYYQNAVHLRKWDDLAKVKNLETPELETYRDAVAHCLK